MHYIVRYITRTRSRIIEFPRCRFFSCIYLLRLTLGMQRGSKFPSRYAPSGPILEQKSIRTSDACKVKCTFTFIRVKSHSKKSKNSLQIGGSEGKCPFSDILMPFFYMTNALYSFSVIPLYLSEKSVAEQ